VSIQFETLNADVATLTCTRYVSLVARTIKVLSLLDSRDPYTVLPANHPLHVGALQRCSICTRTTHFDRRVALCLMLIQSRKQLSDETSDALLELAILGGVDESVDTADGH